MRTQTDLPVWAYESWHSMGWLNSGVLFVSKSLELTVYNALAAQLLEVVVSIGDCAPIQHCLEAEREEYQLLLSTVTTENEYRNHIVTWAGEGRIRHVLIDSFRHEDTDGAYLGMYVVMKDLGDFAVLEQHMQRTDKLATVGKIAAGIAHEIRNPLTTVKGFLQVMENRFTNQAMDEELEFTKVMMTEIERVNALVGELLLLSKPHKVDKQPCSMEALVIELNPFIQSQALLRGVQYKSSVEAASNIVVDCALMKQVLLNLMKNALEAMESGGELGVHVHVTPTFLQIDVSDTGPGIPYYQMDKIFDAFYTTKDKGTGLGLPICQRIVADHGGEIRVSSKGYGTTFTILLPLGENTLPLAT
jgi:two-component system, sporulation sensor kinase E